MESFWIGLFRDAWMWSDGSSSSFRQFNEQQIKGYAADMKCAVTTLNDGWKQSDCSDRKPFYCYDDKVILIKEAKTWDEALNYCREKHQDLISITNPHQQRWVQERAKDADTPFVWVGMRPTCTLSRCFWLSGQLFCYDKWASDKKTEKSNMAAAMDREGKGFEKANTNTFNFICTL
ncbi:snaclec purpureotin subunit beta-like [Cottoperca gobio]|uniref:Snaclec purpureotin subunit beta-like n=1 Tax=Cottoperca gobio TaxID=56716 RepID=A0A6J2RPM3_COTGO|nr:snaclec purpureotin subunit beta-like [Cottoperca gobio]